MPSILTVVEEQLEEVQQQRGGKEGVYVDVKGIRPFHVLLVLIRSEQFVDQQPHNRGHDHADQQEVHEDHVEQQIDAISWRSMRDY